MRLAMRLGPLVIAVLVGLPSTLAGEPSGGSVRAVRLDMGALYVALEYDSRTVPGAHAVLQKFFDAHIPVLPLPKGDIHDRFDPELNVIYWNSTAALQTATDTGAPTGKYVSPALLLLDAINHAVAHSLSPTGYANLSARQVALFGDLEKERAISGLDAGTATGVADVDPILDFSGANGLGNAVAAAMGEPIRTNSIVIFQNGDAVEGVTYVSVADPTWHKN